MSKESKKYPDFYIIGAQKGGSTFLHHCLKEHPEIYMPEEEIALFEKKDYGPAVIKKLENRLSQGKKYKSIGIKRPMLLGNSIAAKRISKYTPSAKIIVILRNPIKRAVSAYYHNMRMGLIPIVSPDKGFATLLEKGEIENYPRSKNILKFGLYAHCLKYYFKYFPRKNVHIVFLEDVKEKPLESIQKMYSFLGVNKNYKPLSLNKRPMKGIYSLYRIRYLKLLHRFLYKKVTPKGIIPKENKTALDAVALAMIYKVDEKLVSKLFPGNKPTIKNELVMLLKKYYKKDIDNLEILLNRKLHFWKKAKITF